MRESLCREGEAFVVKHLCSSCILLLGMEFALAHLLVLALCSFGISFAAINLDIRARDIVMRAQTMHALINGPLVLLQVLWCKAMPADHNYKFPLLFLMIMHAVCCAWPLILVFI